MGASPRDESGWTIETYSAHNEALRDAERRFLKERDRRYSEVQAEREKALRIKEEADARALSLAREIQDYKDEKANELRAQIESERGVYLPRTEYVSEHKALADSFATQLVPIVQFMNRQEGRSSGIGVSSTVLYSILILLTAIITSVIVYTSSRHSTPPTTPTVTVTVPSK